MKRQCLIKICFWPFLISICLNPLTVWASALNYAFQDDKESLHGVVLKTQLEPALRDEIKHIRFSPNGKYIVAQDDAGINVLTREPFAASFRIDAMRVSEAHFTPDSQNIVFHDSDMRVEVWSVRVQKQVSQTTVRTAGYCNQTLLSPDGKTLAYLEWGSNVVLIDVATSSEVLRKDDFLSEPYEGKLILFPRQLLLDNRLNRKVNMDFSPDGHYFAAGVMHLRQRELIHKGRVVADAARTQNPRGFEDDPNNISENRPRIDVYDPNDNAESSRAIALDLTTRKNVSLGGQLKDLMAGGFTFVGQDRVAGVHRNDSAKSALVSFPKGEPIKLLPIARGDLDKPGGGNYLLIRPVNNYPVGVMNLSDGSLLMANKKSAIDIYEDVYVAERADGEIGLYGINMNDLRAKIQLPQGALTNIAATDVSPDFNLIAISGSSRGAVWDLSKGERILFLRGFSGAHYASDGAFYVDFPKLESVGRMIAILQTKQREVFEGQPIEELKGARSEQFGQFLTINRRSDASTDSNKNASLEVQDVISKKRLWLKTFEKRRPSLWVDATNTTMALGWNSEEDVAKAEIKSNNRLAGQLKAIKDKGLVYFYQILNADTGQQRGSILFDTQGGELYPVYVIATNDSVVVLTSRNGVFVYSLEIGEKRTQINGDYATVSRGANLLCVRDKNNHLTIYDLATLKERDQFTFSNPVAMSRFSSDGKRLFVLTKNQTAYVLDLSLTTRSKP